MVVALRIVLAAGLVAALAAPTCFAQAMATRDTLPPPVSAATGPVRKLAPGIVTEIPADARPAEKVSRHDIVEILASDPTYGIPPNSPAPSRAKGVRFEHNVQSLAFGFKPLRMIRADVPNDAGRLQAKLVWYLVFHVKNPGDKPMRFSPVFTLEDLDSHILYPDELLPVVIPAIQKREDPNRPLLNDVAIAGELAPGEDRWGIVTWVNLPSTLKKFSIYIQGLSTAYQWEDPEGAYQPGQPPGSGRKITQKTLQLNFWRPADPFHQHESEIRFGIPGDVDYRWVYR